MSVIGPRPLLSKDVECMNRTQQRRHEVRPGLTGLAQCSGRNSLNWDIKLTTDVMVQKIKVSSVYAVKFSKANIKNLKISVHYFKLKAILEMVRGGVWNSISKLSQAFVAFRILL